MGNFLNQKFGQYASEDFLDNLSDFLTNELKLIVENCL